MIQIKRAVVLFLIVSLALSGCAYHHDIVRLPEGSLYNQTVIFNNVQYVPVLRFCSYYDLDWDWDLVSQKIEIQTGKNTLVLRPGSRLALLNDKTIRLEYPVEYKNGTAYIPAKSAAFISRSIFGKRESPPLPAVKHYAIRTIVIDPGHGGRDPGAVSRYGTREKNIVLDVSKRLKRHLEKRGMEVTLTREKDVFISLRKRAEFANKRNADLFVSVHANASRSSRLRGFEVYYLSEATDDKARAMAAAENAPLKFEKNEVTNNKDFSTKTTLWDMELKENRRQAKELAYYICNITSEKLDMKKIGVKGANFEVLRKARMPGVLAEVGFLTNRWEESKLKKSHFREKIAEGISSSILAYKREYERTNGFSE
jgi:N-acetylmuramoyl-L-alanine amidase